MKKTILCPMMALALLSGLSACGGDSDWKSRHARENMKDNSYESTLEEMREYGYGSSEPSADVDENSDDQSQEYSVETNEAPPASYQTESYSPDSYDDSDDYDDEEKLSTKAKATWKAAKSKAKEKKEQWKEDHADQIESVKEKGRNFKKKTKEKVGRWLDKTREKLED